MARDHEPLSNASSEHHSYHAPTEAEAKARPSARIRTRAPPRRRGKRIEKIAAVRPTPRWSPQLITQASSPSRACLATSTRSWRARAPTTPTLSSTSTRTVNSSSAFCDRPAGQRKKKVQKQRPRKGAYRTRIRMTEGRSDPIGRLPTKGQQQRHSHRTLGIAMSFFFP